MSDLPSQTITAVHTQMERLKSETSGHTGQMVTAMTYTLIGCFLNSLSLILMKYSMEK